MYRVRKACKIHKMCDEQNLSINLFWLHNKQRKLTYKADQKQFSSKPVLDREKYIPVNLNLREFILSDDEGRDLQG